MVSFSNICFSSSDFWAPVRGTAQEAIRRPGVQGIPRSMSGYRFLCRNTA
jgi:hypothetical protein